MEVEYLVECATAALKHALSPESGSAVLEDLMYAYYYHAWGF